nr:DUF1707 domain-containing protein [Propionibacterium sp.]
MNTDDHLRVGAPERQRALEALGRARAEGRLTDDEYDQRSDAARLARTRGDLRGLLADVVAPVPLFELIAGEPVAPPRDPGYSWDDPLVLTAGWDNETRLGRWEVPPFLEVAPLGGNVKLNFVDAVPVSLVIDIVVDGRAGNLVLVVPEGWGVNTSRVDKGMGSIKNRVAERAAPGHPQIMVRGNNRLGDIVARYPNRFDTWQLNRALPPSQRRRPELR